MVHNIYINCQVCGSVTSVRLQVGHLCRHPIVITCGKCQTSLLGTASVLNGLQLGNIRNTFFCCKLRKIFVLGFQKLLICPDRGTNIYKASVKPEQIFFIFWNVHISEVVTLGKQIIHKKFELFIYHAVTSL